MFYITSVYLVVQGGVKKKPPISQNAEIMVTSRL